MDKKIFVVKEKELHYIQSGSGPCLLFLHGLLESAAIWQPLITHFAQRYQVIAVDLPGHGKSEVFDTIHSMTEMAARVWGLLDHLNIKEAKVVGHSMGGYVGISMAESRSGRIKKLCLFHSHVEADGPTKKRNRDRTVEVIEKNPQRCIKEVIPSLFAKDNVRRLQEEINQLVAQAILTPVEGISACLRGMRDRSAKQDWLKVGECDTLFLAGTEDPVMPIAKIRAQVQAGTNVRLVSLQRVAHMGLIEAPTQSIAALEAWLG